jgi:PAS domain S-box-containing protein
MYTRNTPPQPPEEAGGYSEFVSSLINNTPAPILVIDNDHLVRYVNPAFSQQTGFTREEIIGRKPPFPHWPAQFHEQYLLEYAQLSSASGEKLFCKKNGELFWVQIEVSPVTEKDRPKYYISHWTDITARKRMEIELKKSEEELRASEEKYRLVVENASEAIIIIQDGLVKFVNTGTMKLTGYTRPELLLRHFSYFIHADDLEMITRQYFLRLKGDVIIPPYEFRIKTSDNGIRWVEANGAKVCWEGRPATLSMLNDVTERRKTEEKLVKSEALFRLLAEHARDLIFRLRLQPEVTLEYISPSALSITGFSPAEHYADPGILCRLRGCGEGGISLEESLCGGKTREMRWVKKDGAEIWAEEQVTALLDGSGLLLGIEGIVRDISNRKQTEAALANEATKRHILVDQSSDGIVVLDAAGRVYDANRRFAEMIGYTPEEVLNLHVWDWDNQLPWDKISQMLATVDEKGDHFETIHRRKDGTVINVEISSNGAICNSQKLIFCVCRDITERKRLEGEILGYYENEKKQRLEMQEEAKARGLFIDVLAHELRTPLTPILVSTSMLKDLLDKGDDRLLIRLAEIIHNSAQTLTGRLEDLLEVARYSRGTFKLKKQPTRINTFVKDVIARFEPTLDGKNQAMNLKIAGDLPEVSLDQSRIEQVLINLLSNASKFAPDADISVEVKLEGDAVRFSVTDKGIGISAEEQARIFQPYHRVEQDRHRFPGLGLGLAVCKQIVDAHGGKIAVTSQPDMGSTFSFVLPIEAA